MKSNYSVLFIVLALILFSPASYGQKIKHLIHKHKRPDRDISFVLYDTKSNEQLYAYHHNKPLAPASTMKIITALTALEILGERHRFETQVLFDSPHQGQIKGLCLKGLGDPMLIQEDIDDIVNKIYKAGVRHIQGSIAIDDSHFDSLYFDGRDESDFLFYNAPTSALSLLYNNIHIEYVPGSSFELRPNLADIRIIKRPSSTRGYIHINRQYDNDRLNLKIHYDPKSSHHVHVNVPDTKRYAQSIMINSLRNRGISTTSQNLDHDSCAQKVQIRHRSPILSEIVKKMNHKSQNFMAHMLVKNLGAHQKGAPGTKGNGLAVINQFLKTLFPAINSIVIRDGSGLNKASRISAELLAQLLLKFSQKKSFKESLPISGVSGTLKDRFSGPGLKGSIKAKTGTLNHVTSLAGYITTQNSRELAFALIINGPKVGQGGSLSFQEKLLFEIYRDM